VTSGALRGAGGLVWSAGWRTFARAVVVVALALAAGAGFALGVERGGILVAALALAAVGFLALVVWPKLALTALAVTNLALEDDPEAFLSQSDYFYDPFLGGLVEVSDLLLLALLVGVLVDLGRHGRRPTVPALLGWPLLLLSVAIAMGAIMGYFGDHDAGALYHSARKLAYLVLLPILVVNVLRTKRDLHLALLFFVGVMVYKCAEGLTSWLLGAGRTIDETVLTFYSPAVNFSLLVLVLGVLAAVLARIRLPLPLWLLAPIAAAVLILSFRRNFYLALVVCVVLLVLVVSGRQGRALLIPAVAAVLLALWLGFSALAATDSNSPVVERVQSLSPTRIELAAYDRYRIDEQRNVRDELARHPLTGLGLGVPWTARHPVSVSLPGAQQYIHGTVLWYWVKLGILGVVAYVWLMATAVRLGARVWRNATSGATRVAGLALSIGLIGLAVAETTGSFVGVSGRITVLVGVAIGWLAAASRLDRPEPALRS
jgi:O-antigen ligase